MYPLCSGVLRHQCCSDGLEEERRHVQQAGKVGTNAAAEGEHTGEERTDGEEEANEDKCEHEPR